MHAIESHAFTGADHLIQGNRQEYALHLFVKEHLIPHEEPEDQPDWTAEFPYTTFADIVKNTASHPL